MQKEVVTTADSCLVFYGNSVFLAGIKAELKRRIALELITVETGCPDVTDLIRSRSPRAVLFDLGTGPLDYVVQLLRGQPGLLLIGVDSSSNEMLVLSSHPQQAMNITDLVEVITEKESNSESFIRREK